MTGCCLTLSGAIGYLAVFTVAANNMAAGWSTPPGRFITTITKTGMLFPLLVSTIFLVLGLIILAVEFFKKDN